MRQWSASTLPPGPEQLIRVLRSMIFFNASETSIARTPGQSTLQCVVVSLAMFPVMWSGQQPLWEIRQGFFMGRSTS
jgi:hypothetical protein